MHPGVPPISKNGSSNQSSLFSSASTSRSSSSSTSSSSYTSADHSYFSPHTPYTCPSSAPNVAFNPDAFTPSHSVSQTHTTHTTTPSGPVITFTISRRAMESAYPRNTTGGYGGNSVRGPHPAHTTPPEVLQLFALHIPPPPPLTLSHTAMRNASAQGIVRSSSITGGPQYSASAPSSLAQQPQYQTPQMVLSSTPVKHTLSVMLPRNVPPELVTISANKGDRIRVAADAFGEDECKYDWQISFPPHDVDMGAVHARFSPDGLLTLDIKRRSRPMYY